MNRLNISVIIPTYKPENYLWECLNSLVNQTLPKDMYEIILVLNGCADPWNSQIEEYICSNMQGININYIHTSRGGVSNARNIALDAAKGAYVTFIDDDDYISPSYLEEMLLLSNYNTIVLAKPIAFWDDTRNFKEYRITKEYNKCAPNGRQKASKARKFFSGPCMKLIPKEYIQDRRFDVRFKNGEDSLFMFLISDKFNEVVFTSENAIYFRRIRENSATTLQRSKWEMVLNSLKLCWVMSCIYFSHPLSYNFHFYLTRVLGSIHSMFRA